MNDTQLPRYQVFLQVRSGEPYQEVGSVHAPDAELALLNARDVFVRRPECHGFWVVPVEAISSYTAERGAPQIEAGESHTGNPQPYHVFRKPKPASPMLLVGTLVASSPSEALHKAQVTFAGGGFVWWVFPASQVTSSRPEDGSSMFAPARSKGFRMSTDFHTLSAMRQVRQEGSFHEPNS